MRHLRGSLRGMLPGFVQGHDMAGASLFRPSCDLQNAASLSMLPWLSVAAQVRACPLHAYWLGGWCTVYPVPTWWGRVVTPAINAGTWDTLLDTAARSSGTGCKGG